MNISPRDPLHRPRPNQPRVLPKKEQPVEVPEPKTPKSNVPDYDDKPEQMPAR